MMTAVINGVVYLVVAVAYLTAQLFVVPFKALRRLQRRRKLRLATAPGVASESQPIAQNNARRSRGRRGGTKRWEPPPGSGIVQRSLLDDWDAPAAPRARPAEAPPAARPRSKPRPSQAPPVAAPPQPVARQAAPSPAERSPPQRFEYKARWAGRLVEAGVGQFPDTRRTGPDGKAATYSSYYVTLETEDGAIVTKQGVELQKALEVSGAAAGDAVELLLLGKEPVALAEGGKPVVRYRNKWRVNRKGEAWHR